MLIAELLRGLEAEGGTCRCGAPLDTDISGLAYDSRCVKPGDLFFALPGSRTDGRLYSQDAIRAGAAAIVCHGSVACDDLPCLLVDDVASAAGLLASVFYGKPSQRLGLVGVTGTNGKTSCTYLLESIWRQAGLPCGVIGTVSQRGPGFEHAAVMTTPPAIDLHAMLAETADRGCRWVAIEVSSHALVQRRVAGCAFDAAIFTNLTRDHLDYHRDEESYFRAKARLFQEYLRESGGVAVLNRDDPYGRRLEAMLAGHELWTYSTRGGSRACCTATDVALSLDGVRGQLCIGGETVFFSTALLGLPNLSNVLAAAATAAATGIDTQTIARGLAACRPVPGRFERISSGRPVVLVDYAHTPDALDRALATVRGFVHGRVITVFGCGGDRDRGKRPSMGQAAGGRADVVVLTSDNPRSERPEQIIGEIEVGLTGLLAARPACELRAPHASGYLIEPDRTAAIATALGLADPDDLVLVAGKGHETYQEVAGERRDLDDRALVAQLTSAHE